MTQHRGLSLERWSAFSTGQQVLMIGNEMHRASRLLDAADTHSRVLAYERVLRLVDLTVAARPRPAFLRELLRWRDLIGALYLDPQPEPRVHRAALRTLLLLTPESARQIPYVCAVDTGQ